MAMIDSSIQYLKGVGPAFAKKFEKLGVTTIRDLLLCYPRKYIDYTKPYTVVSAPYDVDSCVRATVLQIRSQEFVEAAKATGSGHGKIIFHEILPNILSPLIVDSTMRIGGNILQISGLSFIGLGVQPPTSEWGSIMSAGQEFITTFWPMITFPGIAILLTVFAFNVMGDGLRDALDPRLKQ